MSTEPLATGLDRPAGMMLGAAVGDALGWPQEDRSRIVGGNAARRIEPLPQFREWVRHGGTRYAGYLDPVSAGEYSDDTQLLLATARACLHGPDWWKWFTAVELPQWPLYERGGGGAVLRAARAWGRGRAPWQVDTDKDVDAASKYFQAGGNGVAMRIAPHVVTASVDGMRPEELASRVIRDGLSTHGHPHALVGAVVHATALNFALSKTGTLEYGEILDRLIADSFWMNPNLLTDTAGRDWHAALRASARRSSTPPARAWDEAAAQTLRALQVAREAIDRGTLANDHATLEAIGCFDERRSGAGTVAAVAAVYVASRSASGPVSGLLRTAYLHGSDTDTIASMTGSLLGAVQGTTWLGPMGRQVQDAPYLLEMSWRLTRAERDQEVTHLPEAVSESSIRKWNKQLQEQRVDRLPDGRLLHIEAAINLESKSNSSTVTRFIGRTDDGQTILIDKVSRGPSQRPPTTQRRPDLFSANPTDPPAEVVSEQAGAGARASIVQLELRVSDLDASAQFYGQVLGLRLQWRDGHIMLDNGLRLTQLRSTAQSSPTRGFIMTLVHPDPSGIADRMLVADGQAAWSQDQSVLWLRDPDGNSVRIVQGA